MNDRELKDLLKNAYQITPTAKEKAFIKKYEKRQISLINVVKIEMGHMKLQSGFMAMALILMFIVISKSNSPELMWYVSGILPVASLILMSCLGKSERYGMHELEASSRFSLKFVRLIRMLVLGAAGLCLIVIGSLLLHKQAGFGLMTIVGFVGTPYMLNTWGSLMITRKWHDSSNIIGCISVTALSCMIPVLFERAVRYDGTDPTFIIGILIIGTALTARECVLFMRESEELSWNFC